MKVDIESSQKGELLKPDPVVPAHHFIVARKTLLGICLALSLYCAVLVSAVVLLRGVDHQYSDGSFLVWSDNGYHRHNFLPIPVDGAVTAVTTKWHIDPIKPHHSGRVVYLVTTDTDDGSIQFKRVFTVPCAYGVLVFNVGPAADYLPYAYDLYEDAYAYSNNNGLCVLYPSYTGTQLSSVRLWTPTDPTDMTVKLGDQETKISHRVVTLPNSNGNRTRGGDFVIMRKGNFYNTAYYHQLKDYINSWSADNTTTVDFNDLLGKFQFVEAPYTPLV